MLMEDEVQKFFDEVVESVKDNAEINLKDRVFEPDKYNELLRRYPRVESPIVPIEAEQRLNEGQLAILDIVLRRANLRKGVV